MHTLVEMSSSHGGAGGAHVPAFLAKLWKLVDDPVTNDLIYWSEPGNSFVIRNQAKFSRELLPLYYKHNNMASFVRQLNMYGFHKVVSVEQGGLKLEKDEMEFAHPFFLRGNEPSLELIKRKIPVPKQDDSRLRPDSLQKGQLVQVLLDVRQMKGRQENMDTKLLTMKRENEALWRELAALRQKHANQTTILSKILQFLVGVMSSRNHRLGFKRRMPLMLNDTDETKGKTRRHEEPQIQGVGVTGPVIHDVTEIFEDSNDGMAEATEADGYSSGGESDLERGPIPKVDSPPVANESILSFPGSNVLFSAVDPSAVNVNPTAQRPSRSHSIPQQQHKGKGKGKTLTNKRAPLVDPLYQPDVHQQQFEVQGVPVSVEESEGNSADGFLQPVETTYYITGADGQPLKVCLAVPESHTMTSADNLLLPTSTNTSSLIGSGVQQQGSQSSATATTPAPSTTTDIVQAVDRNLSPQYNLKRNNTIPKKEEFDAHLDDMQLGLDNLRDILKSEEYKMDNSTLLGVSWPLNPSSGNLSEQLFGDGDFNLDLSKLSDGGNGDGQLAPSSGQGQEMVSYNPSLFELTEDDSHFFDDTSNMFLDEELQSMLTTDREKLKAAEKQQSLFNNGDIFAHGSQQQQQNYILPNSSLSTPLAATSSTVPQLQPLVASSPTPPLTGASKRKRK